MCEANFTENFKRDTVAQVADRGYPLREIVAPLGVSNRLIDRSQKRFSPPETAIKEAHTPANAIRRLRRHRHWPWRKGTSSKSRAHISQINTGEICIIAGHRLLSGGRIISRMLLVIRVPRTAEFDVKNVKPAPQQVGTCSAISRFTTANSANTCKTGGIHRSTSEINGK